MRILRKFITVLLIITVMASVLYITSEAGSIAYGAATVGATSLNVRSGPDTSAPLVCTINHNEKLVVLEKTNNDWYHISYHGIEGYVATLYLTNILTAENFNAVGKLAGNDVSMRSTPSTSGGVLGRYDTGVTMDIIGINNGWYKVRYSGKTGYIRSDYITIIQNGTNSSGSSGTTTIASTTNTVPPATQQASTGDKTQRQQIVDYALQYLGYDYVYGGSSPSSGFDCSGFVYYVYHHFNCDLTRTASSQYSHDGTTIKKTDLIPGDLVFFSSNKGYSVTHVGIYIGNNQFVHASSPKVGVVVSSLGSDYYINAWYGAKRVLSD